MLSSSSIGTPGPAFILRYRILIALFLLVLTVASKASDDLVQEILSENQYHDNDSLYFETTLETNDKQERLRDESERQQKLINEQLQREREASFAKELARLKEDKAAIRKLMQQKKRDIKIVNRVIAAFHAGNYYAVLGICRAIFIFGTSRIRIPKLSIPLIPNHFRIETPEIELFGGISEQRIKKSYREMAKRVHPDKSRDPRAVEAFHMVEEAASLLLNSGSRAEYDRQWQEQRRMRRIKFQNRIAHAFEMGTRIAGAVIGTGKKVLGPFTVPVMILLVLIV